MSQEVQLVTFQLAAETFGVEIGEVQEIIPVLPIIRVPDAPPWIEGLVDLRGTILPVIDLRKRFGQSALEEVSTQCIIVVNLPDQQLGLIVDAVRDVARVLTDSVSKVPAATWAGARYLWGIARVPEGSGYRVVLLLEAAKLLNDSEVEALAALT